MIRVVCAHRIKYNLGLVCPACTVMSRYLLTELHMRIQMVLQEMLLLMVMILRAQARTSHVIHGWYYIWVILLVADQKALVLVPVSRLHVRSRIQHLAHVIVVINVHTWGGYLGATVPRIVTLLPSLLFLNLFHNHAFTSTLARGCSTVAKTTRQVLHWILQAHSLLGM